MGRLIQAHNLAADVGLSGLFPAIGADAKTRSQRMVAQGRKLGPGPELQLLGGFGLQVSQAPGDPDGALTVASVMLEP